VKNKLLPFAAALQIYVIWQTYCIVCLWCLKTKAEYEGMAYPSWDISLMESTNGVAEVIVIDAG
jgi:hypothetical protein